MSCPFAGMTRIRFKGFFSARTGAPLGTVFNVCTRAGVSMRARRDRHEAVPTSRRLHLRQFRHASGAAVRFRDDAQGLAIEGDADQRSSSTVGVDAHAVAVLAGSRPSAAAILSWRRRRTASGRSRRFRPARPADKAWRRARRRRAGQRPPPIQPPATSVSRRICPAIERRLAPDVNGRFGAEAEPALFFSRALTRSEISSRSPAAARACALQHLDVDGLPRAPFRITLALELRARSAC